MISKNHSLFNVSSVSWFCLIGKICKVNINKFGSSRIRRTKSINYSCWSIEWSNLMIMLCCTEYNSRPSSCSSLLISSTDFKTFNNITSFKCTLGYRNWQLLGECKFIHVNTFHEDIILCIWLQFLTSYMNISGTAVMDSLHTNNSVSKTDLF